MMRTWIAALFLLSGSIAYGQSATAPFRLGLKQLTSGLSSPLGIANAGDGSHRLFILEQQGRVRIWQGGRLVTTPFLDLTSKVSCCGERGLLGIVFHPNYETNGFFFVNYTDTSGATNVARFRVRTDDPNRAEPTSETLILRVPQPFSNHNGGDLRFGPDGYLYIPLGDGGSAGDPGNRSQNLGELLGKILRIDVDRGSPYSIPADNPFLGVAGARPEIWAVGVRNPWRGSFDRLTGDYWFADVGQNALEEVNFQPASSRGGENYGWRLMEGSRCFNPSTACNNGSRSSNTGGTRECRSPAGPFIAERTFRRCSAGISSRTSGRGDSSQEEQGCRVERQSSSRIRIYSSAVSVKTRTASFMFSTTERVFFTRSATRLRCDGVRRGGR
jgi:hypothetical protein